jgi:hypothetical protein
MPNPYFNQHV